MAGKAFFRRTVHGLAPDSVSPDALDKIKIGTVVAVQISRPRNLAHLRKLFALIKVVHPHQETWPTEDDLREQLLIAAGHCEAVKAMVTDRETGKKVLGEAWKAKSISFEALDQAGFEQVYDAVVGVILRRILPGVSRPELDREVEEILIGNGPKP